MDFYCRLFPIIYKFISFYIKKKKVWLRLTKFYENKLSSDGRTYKGTFGLVLIAKEILLTNVEFLKWEEMCHFIWSKVCEDAE